MVVTLKRSGGAAPHSRPCITALLVASGYIIVYVFAFGEVATLAYSMKLREFDQTWLMSCSYRGAVLRGHSQRIFHDLKELVHGLILEALAAAIAHIHFSCATEQYTLSSPAQIVIKKSILSGMTPPPI